MFNTSHEVTTFNSRSAELEREKRLRMLSDVDRDIIRLANDPLFPRWLEQIKAIGGCAHPIYLSGSTVTRDALTGELISSYSTAGEPGERLAVRCRNRRVSVCEPCSYLHAGDTYQLIRAGLTGGKNVPDAVRDQPRLFVTLTAPSFGSVHRFLDGERCRPRRDGGECEHGRPVGCGLVHAENDTALGRPLCPDCYDHVAHVLWHAHAGRLWDRFTTAVRRYLASAAGIPRSKLRDHLMVSFAKVAEYQKRAAIHFHGVVRLDGPAGPGAPSPDWATAAVLTDAVHTAAASANVRVPESDAYGTELLVFGKQLAVRPIWSFADEEGPTDDAVAAYVAKYVSKGTAETGAGLDYCVTSLDDIHAAVVTPQVRALMATCWRLGGLPELGHLRLRSWAHTLGYRGHILTKSRRYSTTYTALREERRVPAWRYGADRQSCRRHGLELALRRLGLHRRRGHARCRNRRRPCHQPPARSGSDRGRGAGVGVVRGGSNLLMTPDEAAAELGVTKRVLMDSYRRWGIPYLKVGKHVRFRTRDLHNWVEARMRQG